MKIKLLDAVAAENGVPTAGDIDAGHPLMGLSSTGLSHNVPLDDRPSLTLVSVAGSATLTVTVKIWVFVAVVSDWVPLGSHATAALRGVINEGNAIDEVQADKLRHSELVTGLDNYEAIYAQVTAIGGTDTAVDLYIHGR